MTSAASTNSQTIEPCRQSWVLWGVLTVLVGLAGFAGWDSLSSIVSQAVSDSDSSHLLLVPLIAAWLVFVRRKRLLTFRREHLWVGLAVTVVGGFMYLYGAQNLRFWTWHAGAVVMVVGAVLSVVGVDALRRFGPAFLVLAFLAPMPPRVSSALTVPMMSGAAVATEALLSLVGVAVERTGNLLSINGTEVTVEEACAGMRGVWALTLVAVAFAFAAPYRSWVRIVVLLLTPLLALTCNIIRLVPTVWVYGGFEAETADLFHDIMGWVVLFVGYIILTGIVTTLELLGVSVQRPSAPDRSLA